MADREHQPQTRESRRRGGRHTAPDMAREAGASGERGALALRRTTSEYRAAAQEQADRVREEIEAALSVARSTREDIERRIADQLHAPPGSHRARQQAQRKQATRHGATQPPQRRARVKKTAR
ncbi:hypothetical protein LZ198_10150 [Myxococcus sp. K15C18031901]|uniref:hypothetical protein n=1 Tax=Myxococcus dinghuensis TaxID=2906761 RepID=UPI0020A77039|nr:hypothetical protein [Myxococcus dinghuensis]MCP3099231.1 hypothetical protein [Myxococcus dinghuensis]